MPRAAKRPSEAEGRSSSFASLLLGWTQQGMDSFLATQRILTDFATRKTTGAIKNLREGISDAEHSPVALLTEVAAEGTANLTEAQRVLLNLVEQENGIAMQGLTDRIGGSPFAVSVVKRLRNSIDTLVEMQQNLLTIASKHAQEGIEKAKAGNTPDPSCLVDATREAMENFVRTQKKLLEVVVEDGAKPKGGKAEEKKTEVSGLAREAASSFIDAQKNLLDLAGEQINVDLKAATRVADMVNLLRMNPFPTITGEEVRSFVDAEKAVLDSIMKPANGKAASKAEAAAPKRPARRRRTPAAKAAEASA